MPTSVDETIVENYRFRPEDLSPGSRLAGIGAFMRIRNGADFLEATIRSHIGYFDEIVAVYNQCTDATPDILARLAAEYGPDRLRVFHYLPKVFPPGLPEGAPGGGTGPGVGVGVGKDATWSTS